MSGSRTKQREVSLERKPIISQDKPSVKISKQQRSEEGTNIKHSTKQRESDIESRPIISQDKPSVKNSKQATREGTTTRKHATKQRESSIESRPIISQDKPAAEKMSLKNVVPKERSKDKMSVPEQLDRTVKTRATKQDADRQKNDKNNSKPTIKSKTITSPRSTNQSSPRVLDKNNPSTSHKAVKAPMKTSSKTRDATKQAKVSSKATTKSKDVGETITKPGAHLRSRTRTLSPSEVHVLKANPADKFRPGSSASQQNLTAKIRTNEKNIGEASDNKDRSDTKSKVDEDVSDRANEETRTESEDSEDDYEDDFEDYESDFEEATDSDDSDNTPSAPAEDNKGPERLLTSAATRRRVALTSAEEREKKLDSGSYHVTAPSNSREIEEIKAAMADENRQDQSRGIKPTAEEPDEGYLEEEKKSGDFQTIDFNSAEIRRKSSRNFIRAKKRGDLLMEMISLDSVAYNLLDIPAVPYDTFMSSYGKSNTSQVHVQTNEDDCEAEVQTDQIDKATRWTQMPATFSSTDCNKLVPSQRKEERLGVGCERADMNEEKDESRTFINEFEYTDPAKLKKFITNASQRMLGYLEWRQERSIQSEKPSELACCGGVRHFPSNMEDNGPAVHLLDTCQNRILTAQKKSEVHTLLNIWTVTDSQKPLYSLISRKTLKTACFGPGKGRLIFAGASDGSINLWDLGESGAMHQQSLEGNRTVRSPTYSTAEIFKESGHALPVVAIVVLMDTNEDQDTDFSPMQVCSLAENGEVIVWTVVQLNRGTDYGARNGGPNEDLGLAPWGSVTLVNSVTFSAKQLITSNDWTSNPGLTFTSMVLCGPKELLIGENSGNVLICATDGRALKPKRFVAGKAFQPAAVTSIAVSTSNRQHILVGCSDGTVRLHSKEKSEPLIRLHWNLAETSPGTSSIRCLHWLPGRPCMFFALDACQRIHVWNLAESDIYPQFSLPPSTKNPITAAATFSSQSAGSMILGRSNGSLEIHVLSTGGNDEKQRELIKKEAKMFLKYVKIL